MSHRLIDEANALFHARFGTAPNVAARAPGRVNLIGEHTDYNEGFVLPVAIDRNTVVLASATNESTSVMIAADLGREFSVDLRGRIEPLSHGHPSFFANYVLGVIHGFADRGCAVPNMNLVVKSDVPVGAGLSSSASVEVAAATMLESMLHHTLDGLTKVQLCQRAEHAFPGTPCGIMDMYASTFGRANQALLIDCRSNESHPIPLPSTSEMTMLIINTGVKHSLASSEYSARRSACEHVVHTLKEDYEVHSLRDVTLGMLESSSLSTLERRRASHVIMENVRVLLCVSALAQGDIGSFCDQMFESHASLRDLYEVSSPELDGIVRAAWEFRERSNEPHLGARMTGAGFGGCAIVYTRTSLADDVAAFISARFRELFDRDPTIYPTRASDGAALLQPSTDP